jgi:hypothetical protein
MIQETVSRGRAAARHRELAAPTATRTAARLHLVLAASLGMRTFSHRAELAFYIFDARNRAGLSIV